MCTNRGIHVHASVCACVCVDIGHGVLLCHSWPIPLKQYHLSESSFSTCFRAEITGVHRLPSLLHGCWSKIPEVMQTLLTAESSLQCPPESWGSGVLKFKGQ